MAKKGVETHLRPIKSGGTMGAKPVRRGGLASGRGIQSMCGSVGKHGMYGEMKTGPGPKTRKL